MAAWTRDFHRDMGRCAYPLPLFLAESHCRFLAIHPFDDGNGRTARLLANVALLRRRLPPVVIKTEDRDRYIAGLQSADLGQIVPLATFMLENALWSLDLAIRAARGEDIDSPRDVDKEVALFVRRRHGGPPVRRDIDILDNVFFLLVQPAVDALDTRLAPLSPLFRRRNGSCRVDAGAGATSGSTLFEKGSWQRTRDEYLLRPGFRLSDARPTVLGYEVRFSHYVGRGNPGFGVTIAVAWSLAADSCRWEATIDGRREPDLAGSMPYAALAGPPDRLDDWTAKISRLMMDAVDRKAGTRE